MSEWQAIGAHRYRVVADIFWLETTGEFTPEQTHRLLDALVAWQGQQDECGALVDVRGGVGVPAPTRRVMAQRANEGNMPLPIAVVGAGLAARAAFTLMVTAIRLVLRQDIGLLFCPEEAEAVAWLKPKIKERAERVRALKAAAGG